jgi:hypothetical protein
MRHIPKTDNDAPNLVKLRQDSALPTRKKSSKATVDPSFVLPQRDTEEPMRE